MIDLLPGVKTTASALTAERVRMEIVSQNMANINTTRGPQGPYQRKQVVFEAMLKNNLAQPFGWQPSPVVISRVETDDRPPVLVHRPGHVDADANGMVAMPNINVHEELADLMTASRAFEANLSVMQTARAMALQTLTIGKRG